MHKVKFKPENNSDKSNTQERNKNGGVDHDKSNDKKFHEHRNIKKVLLLWFRNTYVKSL